MTDPDAGSAQPDHGKPRARPPRRLGRSTYTNGKGRMEAFSDGVLAVAITLLVIDLAVPASAASRHDLLHAVLEEWPGYVGYLVSFCTVGAMWLGHTAITDYLDRTDAVFLRLNLLFLLFITLLPFVTRMMADFMTTDGAEKVASTIYGVVLLVTASSLSVLWRYALRAGLVRADAADEELALLTDRVTPGLGGYVVLIVLGLFFPVAAVVGYLVVAVFFILPIRVRPDQRRGRGGDTTPRDVGGRP